MVEKLVTTMSGRPYYRVRDEDAMTSDDAYGVPTQQSVKAYVDSVAVTTLSTAATAASNLIVASDDGLTIDDDGNIAGLASAILLSNALKVTINAHYADETEHTSGAQAAIATADATDLDSIIALTTAMLTSYAAHDDDAILAAAWAYHVAQGTEKALASVAAPTTLAESIARLNDIKAKLNDHMDDAAAHTDGDSAQEDTADAAMGAAVEETVAGATTGDAVVWSVVDGGTGTVTGVSAVAGTDKITFTFSADPQADTIVSYLVMSQ